MQQIAGSESITVRICQGERRSREHANGLAASTTKTSLERFHCEALAARMAQSDGEYFEWLLHDVVNFVCHSIAHGGVGGADLAHSAARCVVESRWKVALREGGDEARNRGLEGRQSVRDFFAMRR